MVIHIGSAVENLEVVTVSESETLWVLSGQYIFVLTKDFLT